jgi:hypothetical protein
MVAMTPLVAITIARSRSGTAIGNDVEPRRLRIIESGPELVAGYQNAFLAGRRSVHAWISVRSGGILFQPVAGRLHAIPSDEIRRVEASYGIPTPWIEIDHAGEDSPSPMIVRVDPEAPMGRALLSLNPVRGSRREP